MQCVANPGDSVCSEKRHGQGCADGHRRHDSRDMLEQADARASVRKVRHERCPVVRTDIVSGLCWRSRTFVWIDNTVDERT